jgi:hypothetical protein
MANHLPLTVEVSSFRHLLATSMREAWKAGELYIVANDVNGEERFFIAEVSSVSCLGISVRVICTRQFKSVRAAYRVATASQRTFKRKVANAPHTPSYLHSALRAIVADFAMNARGETHVR